MNLCGIGPSLHTNDFGTLIQRPFSIPSNWRSDSTCAPRAAGSCYHAKNLQVYLGFVIELKCRNPCLNAFEASQRRKQRPKIRGLPESGSRVGYGARAVDKGGFNPRISKLGTRIRSRIPIGFYRSAAVVPTTTVCKARPVNSGQ